MSIMYFDNAATSFPKAPGVGRAMADYIERIGANVNRSTYRAATDAGLMVLEAREKLCRLFNFADPTHAVFTPGMTAGLNMLLKGLLRPGDHVIVSSMEHNAMMRPLTQLKAMGVEFSRIPVDRDGLMDPEDMRPLIKPNTRLIAVMHASNVCGSILPVKELSAMAAEHGIPIILDAAQTAGHYPVDFQELGLSALCAPGHKGLLGPQGIGVMLVDPKLAKGLDPLLSGGTGSASDSEEIPPYMPDRLEPGTMNLPGICGLSKALDFILEAGAENLRRREEELTKRLLDGLAQLPLRIAGTMDMSRRVGVVSIDFEGRDNADLAFRLEQEQGLLTRCGMHCAPSAHMSLGTFPQGTVRLSIGYATTVAEADGAVEAVKAVLGK